MPDSPTARGSDALAGADVPASASRTALDRWLDLADRVLCWVLIVMMAAMLVASVAQVFTRYVLETTLIGPEEVARYMMTGATFMSIPVLARRRNHIAVDALAHYLPNGIPQVLLARLILLFETVFQALFAYFSFQLASELRASGAFSAGLQIPIAWPVSALFIGTGLGALVTAALLVQTFVRPATAKAAGGTPSAEEPVDQSERGLS